ncbi:hypothetical protein SETIT_1G356200v2 [Setaria italica]|uniref:Uncharacterized protein n=1 Tax=Setaria italica TaxID=4555 RepID=K3YWI5_SETIT|nr:uncharacterized protein LOC101769526 [Setaria italica]RCV08807.1 hypothetical protein SETIT_1G356200v2 [Setaria italica]
MAGARAVAVATPAAPPRAADPSTNLAPRRCSLYRVSCRQNPRVAAPVGLAATRSRGTRGPARLSSRDPAEAETDAGAGRIPKDDSSYLWTLGLGSVGGAAVIKYGSILLPDITRPNIVLALLMVSLPVVAAVLILLKASSSED